MFSILSLIACFDETPTHPATVADGQQVEELAQQVESLRRSVAELHAQAAQNALADLEMSLDQDGMARELDACEARITALEDAGFATESYVDEHTSQGAGGTASNPDLEAAVSDIQAYISPLSRYLSVSTADDSVVFHGANVYIQSGDGQTDAANGLGNLVLGYDEDSEGDLDRGGSHNLVIGMDNAYTSYGGVVVGDWDALSEPYTVSY